MLDCFWHPVMPITNKHAKLCCQSVRAPNVRSPWEQGVLCCRCSLWFSGISAETNPNHTRSFLDDRYINEYQLLTSKPVIYLVNLSEEGKIPPAHKTSTDSRLTGVE